jgi:hypothetical protein
MIDIYKYVLAFLIDENRTSSADHPAGEGHLCRRTFAYVSVRNSCVRLAVGCETQGSRYLGLRRSSSECLCIAVGSRPIGKGRVCPWTTLGCEGLVCTCSLVCSQGWICKTRLTATECGVEGPEGRDLRECIAIGYSRTHGIIEGVGE